MQDVRKTIQARLVADVTLRALLGGTATNSRIYTFYQGNATVSTEQPAYITIAQLGRARQGGTVPVTYSLAIWGITQQAVENVRDRLVGTERHGDTEDVRKGLLNGRVLTTAQSRKIYVTLINENENPQAPPNFFGKTVQVQASWLGVD